MIKQFFTWREEEFGFLNPYIIAEIGVNHEGNISLAKEQINLAKQGGAHCVKFQAYKAHLIASQDYSPYYWDITKENTKSQYELFRKYDSFGVKEYQELAKYCQQQKIDFACTPFDLEAIEFLNPLLPFFKIASADITNLPLLRAVAKTNKPIILSTGASTWEEIAFGIDTLETAGARQIALLHCVLNYPTPDKNAQMILQDELAKRYQDKYIIGYSDHIPALANGEYPALDMSVLRGAQIIEKHFTHDITLSGNDHYHAFSPQGLKSWVNKLKLFNTLYGENKNRNLKLEQNAINNARRRIFINKPMNAGEILKETNIIALRSNLGIPIIELDNIIGKTLLVDKSKNSQLERGDFK